MFVNICLLCIVLLLCNIANNIEKIIKPKTIMVKPIQEQVDEVIKKIYGSNQKK